MKKNKLVIVVSNFNSRITEELLSGALEELNEQLFQKKDINIIRVPGALEIPGTINMLLKHQSPRAIIALGAVIKGETAHFEIVSHNSARVIANLSLQSEVPIINGILTTYDISQALKRSDIKEKNKGAEFARAALDIISVYEKIKG